VGSEPPRQRFHWRFGGIFAALLALSAAAFLGFASVGLQYDECLQLAGAVHVLESPNAPPAFAYPRAAWIPLGERWWPLVVIPYAGAVKAYLLLGPFALLGTSAAVCRLVAALILAGGIWGFSRLLRTELTGAQAAAVGAILAIHPALLLHCLYDNGTVGMWILLTGLLAAAVERHRRKPTAASAFGVGLLAGIGVWNRANFVWLLAAALIAVLVVYGRRILPGGRDLFYAGLGAALGVAPLLLYQVASKGEIFRTFLAGRSDEAVATLVARRVGMLRETLLLDLENRQIWGGASPPAWQSLWLLFLLGVSCAICLLPRRGGETAASRFRRASALCLLLFLVLMLTSRLNVSPHHLVTAVPLAAVVVVAGLGVLAEQRRAARPALLAAGLLFAALAVHWNATAARQMRSTGGVGSWSDAISRVAEDLAARHPGREVLVLDWGLATNLSVASAGRVPVREVFWGATREHSGAGPSWKALVSRGGLFVTSAHPVFPAAAEGFAAALASSGASVSRSRFRARSGAPYAELIEVASAKRSRAR
jgi:hypothetical protein